MTVGTNRDLCLHKFSSPFLAEQGTACIADPSWFRLIDSKRKLRTTYLTPVLSLAKPRNAVTSAKAGTSLTGYTKTQGVQMYIDYLSIAVPSEASTRFAELRGFCQPKESRCSRTTPEFQNQASMVSRSAARAASHIGINCDLNATPYS
jgi:hypothetical protein